MFLKNRLLLLLFVMALPLFCAGQESCLNIIPKPQHVKVDEGKFKINSETSILCNDDFIAGYLKEHLDKATGFDIARKTYKASDKLCCNHILLDINASYDTPQEGYELNITPEKIIVKASDRKGCFYAVQTILQLLPATVYGNATKFEKWEIPALEITDAPRFSYRGAMMDVSRTFFELDYIYKFIDWLAYHKMNRFHWHLSDDNGWRIEIKKYPFLTQKGAWRGPDEVIPSAYGSGNKRYGGYYTQEEVKKVIKYAAERNIEIIPEIDMPGHSKAVIGSYPETGCKNETEFVSVNGEVKNVWCVGNHNNYKMIDGIIRELAALFPSKVIHIGGDEVNMDNWKECPVCQQFMKEQGMEKEVELQNYFVRRVEDIVSKYGKISGGWDEILDGGELKDETVVYAWKSVKRAIESIKKNQPTVLQVGEYCYLDMKQSPAERGHSWAGVVTLEKTYSLDPFGTFNVTQEQEKLILGVQGGLWAELLNKPARFSEYQYFPRLCAIAEIGWTEQEKRDYDDFYYRLSKTHYDRLFNMGIAFRVAPPDVVYEDNVLKVSLPYNWAVVRYTTDGSEPVATSNIYRGDIVTHSPENFRFATFYKDVLKSISVDAKNLPPTDYMTPEVSVESSFGESKSFPVKNATDYNFNSYWRTDRTGKAGDYIVYNFKVPVDCSKITLVSGIPNIDLYGVTDGYVEYTYNGTDWIKGEEFIDNKAVILPDNPVKAVKIVFTNTTDALCVAIQDLRIEK